MSIFSRRFDEDDLLEDDGPMFGGAERYEEKKAKLERAKEIASGWTSGIFEKDEEVWELVKELEEKDSK